MASDFEINLGDAPRYERARLQPVGESDFSTESRLAAIARREHPGRRWGLGALAKAVPNVRPPRCRSERLERRPLRAQGGWGTVVVTYWLLLDALDPKPERKSAVLDLKRKFPTCPRPSERNPCTPYPRLVSVFSYAPDRRAPHLERRERFLSDP